MYEDLQFALMDMCRDIEWTNEELAFVIPNPLFEIEYKNNN
jgi:hypothetical protein